MEVGQITLTMDLGHKCWQTDNKISSQLHDVCFIMSVAIRDVKSSRYRHNSSRGVASHVPQNFQLFVTFSLINFLKNRIFLAEASFLLLLLLLGLPQQLLLLSSTLALSLSMSMLFHAIRWLRLKGLLIIFACQLVQQKNLLKDQILAQKYFAKLCRKKIFPNLLFLASSQKCKNWIIIENYHLKVNLP